MRLIDADELLAKWDSLSERGRTEFDQVIMNQPIAYDVEQVVEQLEEYANSNICYKYDGCPYRDMPNVHCENCGALGALEIVRKGGVE